MKVCTKTTFICFHIHFRLVINLGPTSVILLQASTDKFSTWYFVHMSLSYPPRYRCSFTLVLLTSRIISAVSRVQVLYLPCWGGPTQKCRHISELEKDIKDQIKIKEKKGTLQVLLISLQKNWFSWRLSCLKIIVSSTLPLTNSATFYVAVRLIGYTLIWK